MEEAPQELLTLEQQVTDIQDMRPVTPRLVNQTNSNHLLLLGSLVGNQQTTW